MILVIGDINLDIIVNLREEINFDTDSQSEIYFQGGGSAANFSYWLDYLKQEVRFIAKTGDDFIVDFLKKEFKNLNIEFINLRSDKYGTGRIVVLLDESGARTMITDRGANQDIKPLDIKEEYFEGVNHFHIGGYSFFDGENMENTAMKAIKMAKEKNISISFDPSSYSQLNEYGVRKILNKTEGIDFCFPNMEEGKILTNKEKPKEIVKYLINYYQNVILKLGKKGCYVGTQNELFFVKQKKKLAAGDTTGAGDAFSAAFISEYLKSRDLKQAAECANSIGFECVNKIGGRPDSKEV